MSNSIRIIAGLGNPGDNYQRTLHNAGFWFVDALAREYGGGFRYDKKFDAECGKIELQGKEIWLVKPQSFMNLSGGPIRKVMDYYRLNVGNLMVAHDEIDLPSGTTRLKMGGGHGGHNGLRDIMQHCGAEFVRLRLGVGHPGDKSLVTDYVLKRGSADVERAIEENISDAIKIMPLLIDDGLNAATKALHTKE